MHRKEPTESLLCPRCALFYRESEDWGGSLGRGLSTSNPSSGGLAPTRAFPKHISDSIVHLVLTARETLQVPI